MLTLRALIATSLLWALLSLTITGLCLLLLPHSDGMAITHIFSGFWLSALAVWHIAKNAKPLGAYLTKKHPHWGYPTAAISTLLMAVLLSLFYQQTEPFKSLYSASQQIRSANAAQSSAELAFQQLTIAPKNAHGLTFELLVRKGAHFMWPQYAFWLEADTGEFIQPLYVTQALAHNNFIHRATAKNPQAVFRNNPLATQDQGDASFTFTAEPDSAAQRKRPESLPVFLHAAATTQAPAVDAYAGATQTENFILATQALRQLPQRFKLRFEINQSFDFNTYYSSDRFPDDPIYSGNGYSGQPSVIYEVRIDQSALQPIYALQLIGHGHHAGRDGAVHTDMSGLTTAKALVEKILLEVKKTSN
jgi:hypothetical protein